MLWFLCTKDKCINFVFSKNLGTGHPNGFLSWKRSVTLCLGLCVMCDEFAFSSCCHTLLFLFQPWWMMDLIIIMKGNNNLDEANLSLLQHVSCSNFFKNLQERLLQLRSEETCDHWTQWYAHETLWTTQWTSASYCCGSRWVYQLFL